MATKQLSIRRHEHRAWLHELPELTLCSIYETLTFSNHSRPGDQYLTHACLWVLIFFSLLTQAQDCSGFHTYIQELCWKPQAEQVCEHIFSSSLLTPNFPASLLVTLRCDVRELRWEDSRKYSGYSGWNPDEWHVTGWWKTFNSIHRNIQKCMSEKTWRL